ncbi:ubiquinol-cytochrome c reductase cytochrome b subunit [Streptomyces sp. Li-HN-5-11]|uniref:cytochrome bc1 complex cytochrome b subunit n=1 Tax=Streptomyces sp. Li-HN-5-11 TaxID=3075432 RepID=UPI0028A96EF0|nr:ubiquinol-cytochrome c reductase cytochrome b subunit [Streptomyces sp. Li-HN-5-11]WNM36572.1 ubiquinol-cytochrome c reductase cytochrome b subunit [Streptomyces sp. Li-HN-5-11]
MRKLLHPEPQPTRGERFATAVDRRVPLSEAGKQFLRKAFPDHWSFLLGEIALYSFVVLVLTGTFLTFFFHPSMEERPYNGSYEPLLGQMASEAYTSALHISFDVRGGLLIRQMHHWAALVFVAAIGVHMLRIFFTGAFRRPREGNWVIGVTLFWLAILEGFCGYSLPDDLLSGTGLRTAEGIVLSIPIVGTYLTFFIFGGQYPGHEIIPRMYAAHILLIPGLMIALIAVHLGLVVYLKHTQWAGPKRTNQNVIGKPLYPQYTTKSVGLFFILFGVLAIMSALMQINPIWDFGPYRADQASIDAQPDWYLGWLEGSLRLMPRWETNFLGHTIVWDVFIPAVVLPVLMFGVLYVYPFFERWVTGGGKEYHLCDRPRNQPTRTGLGVAGITFFGVLLLDGSQDVLERVFRVPFEIYTWTLRVGLFVLPVLGFWLTKRLCLGLQAKDRARLVGGKPTAEVRLSADGTYTRAHEPLSKDESIALVVRDTPRPLHKPGRWYMPVGRYLRRGLSRWYYAERVEMPLTEEARRQVAAVTAGPAEAQKAEEESGE